MSKFIKYILAAVGVIGLAGVVSASAGSGTVIQKGTGLGTLSGYYFGEAVGPNGNEWQCPDSIGYNKELPRATFYYFSDAESARRGLPENSEYWMSLDGTWKFHWVPEPSQRTVDFYKPDYDVTDWDDIEVPSNWNIAGLQKDGSQRYGKPIYVNQKVIFQHQVK